jgi:hypothetical protein
MTATRAWNESLPAGTDSISGGDDEIRNTKLDIRERMAIDHIWNDSTTTDGYHKKITLNEVQTSDPTAVANRGFLYLKDVSAVVELFWEDESGNVKQLTTGGKLNVSSTEAVLLTGDQTIAGNKTTTGLWTFNTSIPVLPASDPTTDNQATRKAYVDGFSYVPATPTANQPIKLDSDAKLSTGLVVVGTYTGNGAASRDINVGFTPRYVRVVAVTTQGANVSHYADAITGNYLVHYQDANSIHNFLSSTEMFQGIVTNGFRTGTNTGLLGMNNNGTTYFYFAIK